HERTLQKVAKLENKQFKADVNFRYQKFLEENPEMKKKHMQKLFQKKRIKKEYTKAKRAGAATKSAKQAVQKTASKATAVAKKLQEILAQHASLIVTIGIFAILLILIMTAVSSCGAMFVNTVSTTMAGSYISKPAELDAVDAYFTKSEMDLQDQIDAIESDYPGYDEYSYNIGAIGHNPFTLINYLSAKYMEFVASEVEGEVQSLFNAMYQLTITPTTETRTRTVINSETGEAEEEEYEVSVLKVVLNVNPLESLVTGRMDAEQSEIYVMYGETKGLLQMFATPVDLYWYNYISSYYGYRKNPNTGNREFHRGLDIAVPTGTIVKATHDGTITVATYDSYYGNYVEITNNKGYVTKYAHLDSLSVSRGQSVTTGTVLGTTGNTGSSTGSHLHIECLYNGEYFNPLFYFDVGTGTLYGEIPGGGGGSVIPPESYDDATVQRLFNEATRYIGKPYTFGGTPPSSFDCSGFVCWSFSNSGVHDLPRTTAQGIYNQCTLISALDANAGDLIFFQGTYNTGDGRAVTHVGIYCGNGVMLHCGDPIGYASVNTPYWQNHFYSYGRLN
ncbi:MAG: peptidoglycan DD-metalloendopeptidase family protein, partial [Lachnospiraceae bacterium]|nr:peptidoglycan DD-metalloendopeptidase family protein [Lachnospiraceae bacterium]